MSGYRPSLRNLLLIPSLILVLSSCSDPSLKYYNLGLDSVHKGDLDQAVDYWQKSLKYRPEDPETRFNIATALMEMGKYEEAEIHLRRAIENETGDHEIYQSLGRSLEYQDKLPEAKKAYHMSMAIKKNYFPPYIGFASCALKQKQYRTAEKYSALALRISTRDLQGNLILAEAYFGQSNYQEAYAQLLSIRFLNRNNPDMLLLLGKVMTERHMYNDALETLKLAGKNGISSSELFLYLGKSSYEIKHYPSAEKYFGLAIYKGKTDPRPLIGLAQTFMKTGELDKSLESWEKASLLDPGDPTIDLGISIVHINSRRFEQAAAILEELAARENFPPITLYYLGHATMRLGRKAEAQKAFEEFMRTWQGDEALKTETEDILITL